MQRWEIEYEPRLVEEAVLLAVPGSAGEAEFRVERDRLYEISEPEEREASFRALHAAWLVRLGLGQEVERAFAEHPSIAASTHRGVAFSASSGRDEGAEIFVSAADGASGAARRTVILRLRGQTLAIPERLDAFLRHELLHIADMLDPRFGYEPQLPSSPAGPVYDQLLRERYRVLWDAFVDGRLMGRGQAAAGLRVERLGEFSRTFPMLGEQTEEAFERFFGGVNPTHPELVAFATDPPRALGRHPLGRRPGQPCPLCGFPTYVFESEPDGLPIEVQAQIRETFPGWSPGDGLCSQCADLYRSRLPRS
ncbi:MAG: hypothetical protein ACE5JD_13645 [Candidatus Methylomirabilia bacterium]